MNISPLIFSAMVVGGVLVGTAFTVCRSAMFRRKQLSTNQSRLIRQGLSNAETFRNSCFYGRL